MSISSTSTSTGQAPRISLQYGIYQDGQNNLSSVEDSTSTQALASTKQDPHIAMSVEVTSTGTNATNPKTYDYTLANGVVGNVVSGPERDMSQRAELADFVFWLLQNSHVNGAKQTWLELVDHGAGDAGGLFTVEPDGESSHMSEDTVAAAIADGEAMYAKAYPNDPRKIDGVVMHECFEGTLGVMNSLQQVGVRYLAASPETTIAPGVPATAALDIDKNINDPQQMATDVVKRVMTTRYDQQGLVYGPTAAFDVFDLNPTKMASIRSTEHTLNSEIIAENAKDPKIGAQILKDAKTVDGMQRDDRTAIDPWRGDRPTIKLDEVLDADTQLPHQLRLDAYRDASAVGATVMAHAETKNAVGFGADYTDAVGPTRHFPVTYNEIDPLAPKISVTEAGWNYTSGNNAVTEALLLKNNVGGTASAA